MWLPRRGLDHRIAQATKRQEQSKAALADLKARERQLDRKLDTRRKIIAGATLFACAKANRAFHEQVCMAFQAANMRPQDRALLPEFFRRPSRKTCLRRAPRNHLGSLPPARLRHEGKVYRPALGTRGGGRLPSALPHTRNSDKKMHTPVCR